MSIKSGSIIGTWFMASSSNHQFIQNSWWILNLRFSDFKLPVLKNLVCHFRIKISKQNTVIYGLPILNFAKSLKYVPVRLCRIKISTVSEKLLNPFKILQPSDLRFTYYLPTIHLLLNKTIKISTTYRDVHKEGHYHPLWGAW